MTRGIALLSLMMSLQARAECEEVIQKCDFAIQKQGELIGLLVDKTATLEQELNYQKEQQASSSKRIVWIILGSFVLGAVVGGISR